MPDRKRSRSGEEEDERRPRATDAEQARELAIVKMREALEALRRAAPAWTQDGSDPRNRALWELDTCAQHWANLSRNGGDLERVAARVLRALAVALAFGDRTALAALDSAASRTFKRAPGVNATVAHRDSPSAEMFTLDPAPPKGSPEITWTLDSTLNGINWHMQRGRAALVGADPSACNQLATDIVDTLAVGAGMSTAVRAKIRQLGGNPDACGRSDDDGSLLPGFYAAQKQIARLLASQEDNATAEECFRRFLRACGVPAREADNALKGVAKARSRVGRNR